MERFCRILASALLTSVALVASAQEKKTASLDVGDPAPVLRPSKWLKGAPLRKFEKGRVYVVEFWATWCEPCKEAMPHLSELARKYKNQVDFIGVDAAEPNALPKVADFVKSAGARMDYRVAADVPGDRTGPDWMKAAGEAGIPVTFVVGKDGRIAWIGHPSGLDAILPKALAGTLDLSAERARRTQTRDPRNAVLIALGDQDYPKVVALIDAEVARHPEAANFCALEMYGALAHTDVSKLRKRARADLDRTHGDFGTYNWLTLALLSTGLPLEAYRFGVEIVDEALTRCDQKLLLLARGSQIAMSAGNRSKAIDLQAAAIQTAEASGTCSPERLAELRQDLERYKSAGS